MDESYTNAYQRLVYQMDIISDIDWRHVVECTKHIPNQFICDSSGHSRLGHSGIHVERPINYDTKYCRIDHIPKWYYTIFMGIKNMRTLIVALFLIFSIPAQAENIKINVLGMVCDFCAQSIWKVFMLDPATEHVSVDLEKGVVELITDDTKSITDETITQHLEDAGYTVDSIIRG